MLVVALLELPVVSIVVDRISSHDRVLYISHYICCVSRVDALSEVVHRVKSGDLLDIRVAIAVTEILGRLAVLEVAVFYVCGLVCYVDIVHIRVI